MMGVQNWSALDIGTVCVELRNETRSTKDLFTDDNVLGYGDADAERRNAYIGYGFHGDGCVLIHTFNVE
jgi:hypothetical protein